MTGRQSHDKRVVYLDGYAGEGRYENGAPASAEIALRVASHFRARYGVTVECFFTEAQQKSFERLAQVVEHYRAGGVRAYAHRGEVDGVLDSVIQQASRQPLFLFLDPCGLVLPQDRLVDVLKRQRPQKYPATELLMNFSMMAVWRLGGHVRSPRETNGRCSASTTYAAAPGGASTSPTRQPPPPGRAQPKMPSRPWPPSTPAVWPGVPACSCSRCPSRTMNVNAPCTGWCSPPAARTGSGCSVTPSPGPGISGGKRWMRGKRRAGN
ncbi:three-Cys-motif partner protein TcmP [Streptomyces chrestomyceticus]|uniref:three-Cys-motif partner protein TcmP n=1 Tax=Streptomyces chrestomyceticus TaxID=68185 RepID=UPI0035314B05